MANIERVEYPNHSSKHGMTGDVEQIMHMRVYSATGSCAISAQDGGEERRCSTSVNE
jgi:hypothetical protein